MKDFWNGTGVIIDNTTTILGGRSLLYYYDSPLTVPHASLIPSFRPTDRSTETM